MTPLSAVRARVGCSYGASTARGKSSKLECEHHCRILQRALPILETHSGRTCLQTRISFRILPRQRHPLLFARAQAPRPLREPSQLCLSPRVTANIVIRRINFMSYCCFAWAQSPRHSSRLKVNENVRQDEGEVSLDPNTTLSLFADDDFSVRVAYLLKRHNQATTR